MVHHHPHFSSEGDGGESALFRTSCDESSNLHQRSAQSAAAVATLPKPSGPKGSKIDDNQGRSNNSSNNSNSSYTDHADNYSNRPVLIGCIDSGGLGAKNIANGNSVNETCAISSSLSDYIDNHTSRSGLPPGSHVTQFEMPTRCQDSESITSGAATKKALNQQSKKHGATGRDVATMQEVPRPFHGCGLKSDKAPEMGLPSPPWTVDRYASGQLPTLGREPLHLYTRTEPSSRIHGTDQFVASLPAQPRRVPTPSATTTSSSTSCCVLRWHADAAKVGQLLKQSAVFVKKRKDGSISLIYEQELRVRGVHAYDFFINQGPVSASDGVGFVFGGRVPCSKNVKRLWSVFVNRTGHIVIRLGHLMRRADRPQLPAPYVGMVLSMVVDLDNYVAVFQARDGSSGYPLARYFVDLVPIAEVVDASSGYLCAAVTRAGMSVGLAPGNRALLFEPPLNVVLSLVQPQPALAGSNYPRATNGISSASRIKSGLHGVSASSDVHFVPGARQNPSLAATYDNLLDMWDLRDNLPATSQFRVPAHQHAKYFSPDTEECISQPRDDPQQPAPSYPGIVYGDLATNSSVPTSATQEGLAATDTRAINRGSKKTNGTTTGATMSSTGVVSNFHGVGNQHDAVVGSGTTAEPRPYSGAFFESVAAAASDRSSQTASVVLSTIDSHHSVEGQRLVGAVGHTSCQAGRDGEDFGATLTPLPLTRTITTISPPRYRDVVELGGGRATLSAQFFNVAGSLHGERSRSSPTYGGAQKTFVHSRIENISNFRCQSNNSETVECTNGAPISSCKLEAAAEDAKIPANFLLRQNWSASTVDSDERDQALRGAAGQYPTVRQVTGSSLANAATVTNDAGTSRRHNGNPAPEFIRSSSLVSSPRSFAPPAVLSSGSITEWEKFLDLGALLRDDSITARLLKHGDDHNARNGLMDPSDMLPDLGMKQSLVQSAAPVPQFRQPESSHCNSCDAAPDDNPARDHHTDTSDLGWPTPAATGGGPAECSPADRHGNERAGMQATLLPAGLERAGLEPAASGTASASVNCTIQEGGGAASQEAVALMSLPSIATLSGAFTRIEPSSISRRQSFNSMADAERRGASGSIPSYREHPRYLGYTWKQDKRLDSARAPISALSHDCFIGGGDQNSLEGNGTGTTADQDCLAALTTRSRVLVAHNTRSDEFSLRGAGSEDGGAVVMGKGGHHPTPMPYKLSHESVERIILSPTSRCGQLENRAAATSVVPLSLESAAPLSSAQTWAAGDVSTAGTLDIKVPPAVWPSVALEQKDDGDGSPVSSASLLFPPMLLLNRPLVLDNGASLGGSYDDAALMYSGGSSTMGESDSGGAVSAAAVAAATTAAYLAPLPLAEGRTLSAPPEWGPPGDEESRAACLY